MERFQPILLNVWREACRHIEIGVSTATIAAMLTNDLPLEQVLIREVVPGDEVIKTIAVGFISGEISSPARTPCPTSTLETLQCRLDEGRILHITDAAEHQDPVSILTGQRGQSALCASLGNTECECGVLVLLANPGQRFNQRHESLAQALIAPFATSYRNYKHMEELTRLKEAAEANNQSLLRRLGRAQLGDTIVGSATGLKNVLERVDLVARSTAPVMIFGETGAGKELIARAIHQRSDRHEHTFFRVNCGAIPPDLVDSELFGHEKGAFTGALNTRAGWFERADGGTLFLDEIGELSPNAQVRLLRVLQDGWLERVGGHKPLHVDVRIIAATHRNLPAMVSTGDFRADLWYRLSVFPLVLPPLRERKEDIAALAEHFAGRAAKRFGLRPAKPTPDEITRLRSYDWPGNVRELAAVIDRAAILGNGRCLEIEKALGPVVDPSSSPPPVTSVAVAEGGRPFGAIAPLSQAIRSHIEKALTQTKGRIEGRYGAARLLAINPHTLRAKMRKLGIDWTRFREPRDRA